MKKKKILMAFVTILSLLACGTLTRISAYAESGPIRSRGNFVLGSGEMSIYASDMDYLQSEVQALYGELPSLIDINTLAMGTARRNDIQSKGIIDYSNGTVVLDSSDFTYLADEIDSLEFEYKANTVAALNNMGTYFKLDGSVTHNQEEETLPYQYASNLSLNAICGGILKSQSVDHLAAAPATADNISKGAASWVNGQCIIGNGKDVEGAYDQGYNAGYADGYKEGYEQGDADGYERGYDEGYKKGDSDGYDRGYDAGYKQGKSDGYNDGYEKGKSDGYKEGYGEGKKDTIENIYENKGYEEEVSNSDLARSYLYRTRGTADNNQPTKLSNSQDININIDSSRLLYSVTLTIYISVVPNTFRDSGSASCTYTLKTVEGTVIETGTKSLNISSGYEHTNYNETADIYIDLLSKSFSTSYDHLILTVDTHVTANTVNEEDSLCISEAKAKNLKTHYIDM